ncbi:hypothetical protein [Corynebacterium aquilae]|uniref:Uncharacterized protein n=1 Tax=Corynebacterium aquilae DSM 44791 TaxID=1431546 RepID=A0A1L7CHG3_9CORY|nr:hypothetical protein [Corynebacterium aquilae]APT85284.1 hypothetical protein CAQU_09610 [Corynebacterium aquilae DSM 44791]
MKKVPIRDIKPALMIVALLGCTWVVPAALAAVVHAPTELVAGDGADSVEVYGKLVSYTAPVGWVEHRTGELSTTRYTDGDNLMSVMAIGDATDFATAAKRTAKILSDEGQAIVLGEGTRTTPNGVEIIDCAIVDANDGKAGPCVMAFKDTTLVNVSALSSDLDAELPIDQLVDSMTITDHAAAGERS